MSKRIATLAMLVLLLAAAAFVVDVVSPFTPTPNAAFAKNLLLLCFCLFALTLAFHFLADVGEGSGPLWKELDLPLGRRSLIVLICLLPVNTSHLLLRPPVFEGEH